MNYNNNNFLNHGFNNNNINMELLTCRICLERKPKSQNVPISLIHSPFKDIMGFDLIFDRELPQSLCTSCCLDINNYWAFRKMMIEKQNHLLANLNKHRQQKLRQIGATHSSNIVIHPLYPKIHELNQSSATRSNIPPPQPQVFYQQPQMSFLYGPRQNIPITATQTRNPTNLNMLPNTPSPQSQSELNFRNNMRPGNDSNNKKTFVVNDKRKDGPGTSFAFETFEIIELPDETQEPNLAPLRNSPANSSVESLDPSTLVQPILGSPQPSSFATAPREREIEDASINAQIMRTIKTEDLMKEFMDDDECSSVESKPKRIRGPNKRKKVVTVKEGFRSKCLICGCCTSDRNYNKLPTNSTARTKWLLHMGYSDLSVPADSVICDEHFDRSNYFYRPLFGKTIKKSAVPIISDNEKVLGHMRLSALNDGIIKDCSVALELN